MMQTQSPFKIRLGILFLCFNAIIQAQPGSMAVYYGWPSKVNNNGISHVNHAVEAFDDYDLILFGDGLQLPQPTGATGEVIYYGCDQTHHPDHDNTTAIINALVANGKQVFGYTTAAGNRTAYKLFDSIPCAPTVEEMIGRINQWNAMGVTGIFLDEAEWGFGASRVRQNQLIDTVHALGLKVMINGYNPDDVLSSDPAYEHYFEAVQDASFTLDSGTSKYRVYYPLHGFAEGDRIFVKHDTSASYYGVHNVTQVIDQDSFVTNNSWNPPLSQRDNSNIPVIGLQMNPDGLTSHIQAGDIIMLEHFAVKNGISEDPNILNRATKAQTYKQQLGIEVATLPTNWDSLVTCVQSFDAVQFAHALDATQQYDFDYMAWGEANHFSAAAPCDNILPFHDRNLPFSQWNFDEGPGNTTTEDFFGVAGGTLFGLPTWTPTTNKPGYALTFDGNSDFVDILNFSPYDMGTSDFTFEAWIKPQSLITPHSPRVIMGRYNWHPMFYIGLHNPKKIVARLAVSSNPNEDVSTIHGYSLNLDQWYHVVVVFDRDANMTIYVNGQLYGQPVSIAHLSQFPMDSNNNRLRFGSHGSISQGSQFFKGAMDRLAVFKRTLTAAEILSRFQIGSPD